MHVFDSVARRAGGQILDVTMNRDDAARGKARVRAPDGADIAIDLPDGMPIRDGDVFGPSDEGTYYRVLIETGEAPRSR